MPEVQNIGAVDYAQQYQNQNPQQYNTVPEDIQAQEIYDPAIAEKQKSKSSVAPFIWGAGIGALAAGLLTHHFSAKSATKALKEAEIELESLKSSEAIKNYDGLKKATDEVQQVIEQKISWNPKTWFSRFKLNKIKDILNPFKKDAKVAEEGAKAVEEGAESAAKAAEEAVENAAENAAK